MWLRNTSEMPCRCFSLVIYTKSSILVASPHSIKFSKMTRERHKYIYSMTPTMSCRAQHHNPRPNSASSRGVASAATRRRTPDWSIITPWLAPPPRTWRAMDKPTTMRHLHASLLHILHPRLATDSSATRRSMRFDPTSTSGALPTRTRGARPPLLRPCSLHSPCIVTHQPVVL